jgi:hypothetical protein
MGARRDPREENSTPPGEGRTDKIGALPPLARPKIEPPAAEPEAAESAPPASTAPRVVTSPDPRIEATTTALASGDWRRVATDLGPLAQAGALPPTLGLVCALAHHEAGDESAAQLANDLAIRSTASIFGVPPDSTLALVLAKRLMRKNPVAWQKRPAPPAGTSLLIVVATLAIGGGIGWLMTSGLVKLNLHSITESASAPPRR